MQKGWVFCFTLAAGLFGAGIVWSALLGPYLGVTVPTTFGWGATAQVVSALATSIAAIAAWKAASRSGHQLEAMQKQARWQQYELHYRQFNGLLEEIEKTTVMTFFQKWDFYEDLFPSNRKFSRPFSHKSEGSTVELWHVKYQDLLSRSQSVREYSPELLVEWVQDLFRLANSMHLEMLPISDEQLRIKSQKLSLGVSRANAKTSLFKVGLALDSMSRFCEVDQRVVHKTLSPTFESGLLALFAQPEKLPLDTIYP